MDWTTEAALAHVDRLKGEALAGDEASLKTLRDLLDDQTFPDAGRETVIKAIDELGAGPVEDQAG